MNHAPCCEEHDLSTGPAFVRPRLFNWITILLVTAWVGIVAIVAEHSHPTGVETLSAKHFIETLAK